MCLYQSFSWGSAVYSRGDLFPSSLRSLEPSNSGGGTKIALPNKRKYNCFYLKKKQKKKRNKEIKKIRKKNKQEEKSSRVHVVVLGIRRNI